MTNNCKKCGMPKETSKSGRLSQFVLICTCNLQAASQDIKEATISICVTCGKMIRKGRKGSITQFIFRSDICDCDRPSPAYEDQKSINLNLKPLLENEDQEVEEEEELDISGNSFPIDRYKPLELLGTGANGEVYLARDRLLNKKVAVKTLKTLDSSKLIQFQEEAKATSLLNHQNIVNVFDFGVMIDSTPYMILEYFDSKTLKDLLDEKGVLSWSELKTIVIEISKALQYAHVNGVFHRDIKPENILVENIADPNPSIKLIDFGVAKVSQLTGSFTQYEDKTLAGTPAYMSPDPIMGKEYSASSEVYSLGCVAYEALSGSPPFQAETAMEVLALHAAAGAPELSEIPHLNLPEEAIEFVERSMSMDEENKFEGFSEVLNLLEPSSSEFIESEESNTSIAASKPKRLKPIFLIASSFIILAIPLAIYSFMMDKEPEKKAVKIDHRQIIAENDIEKRVQGKLVWYGPKGPLQESQLEALAKLKAKRVELPGLELNQKQLKLLCALPLRELDLRNTNITDSDLDSLSNIKSLRLLILDGCTNISGDGLKKLSKLSKLELLAISDTNMKEKELKKLSNLTQLKILHMSGNKNISDQIIPTILSLKKLVLVGIGATSITKDGIAKLQSHNNIRGLGLASLNLTDRDLPDKFKQDLCFLDLSDNQITDLSIPKILKLSNLWFLRVAKCEKLSLQGLNLLSNRFSFLEGKIFMSDRVGAIGGENASYLNKIYLPPEFYYQTDAKKATQMYLEWGNLVTSF